MRRRWTRSYTNKHVKVTTTYAMTSPQSARIASVTAHRETKRPVGLGADWTETETLSYDKTLKVPDVIHDETDQGAKGTTQEHPVIDIKLTKDSFATPPHPSKRVTNRQVSRQRSYGLRDFRIDETQPV